MRRLARRVFTLCTLASAVVICVFWVRSHGSGDSWERLGERYYGVKSSEGVVVFASYSKPARPFDPFASSGPPRWQEVSVQRGWSWPRFLGFDGGDLQFAEGVTVPPARLTKIPILQPWMKNRPNSTAFTFHTVYKG